MVFCDTEADTYTIDPKQIETMITPRTVGIIPVHLFGQAADMDAIMHIARKHGLWVIEDCAQAHLARYKGRLVGTFGDAATFSFYPGKNLGAMGDAGAIVTQDGDLARRLAMYARHGALTKGDHEIEGINSRLDGLQAAILSVKLRHLPKWTSVRQRLAKSYDRALKELGSVIVPPVGSDREHVYHLYVIRHPQRDALVAHLKESGIQTLINYPTALPFLPAYQHLGHRAGGLPKCLVASVDDRFTPYFRRNDSRTAAAGGDRDRARCESRVSSMPTGLGRHRPRYEGVRGCWCLQRIWWSDCRTVEVDAVCADALRSYR